MTDRETNIVVDHLPADAAQRIASALAGPSHPLAVEMARDVLSIIEANGPLLPATRAMMLTALTRRVDTLIARVRIADAQAECAALERRIAEVRAA